MISNYQKIWTKLSKNRLNYTGKAGIKDWWLQSHQQILAFQGIWTSEQISGIKVKQN